MPTTVFSVALGGSNTGNGGTSWRNFVTVTGGSLGQVQVSFLSGTGGLGFKTDHCSIAVKGSATAPNVQSTPTELLFTTDPAGGSGGHGFNATGVSQTVVSDWLTFSFLSSDTLAVIVDINSSSSGDMGIVTGSPAGVVSTWFNTAATYNQATVTGGTTLVGDDLSVLLIQTQVGVIDAGGVNIMRVQPPGWRWHHKPRDFSGWEPRRRVLRPRRSLILPDRSLKIPRKAA